MPDEDVTSPSADESVFEGNAFFDEPEAEAAVEEDEPADDTDTSEEEEAAEDEEGSDLFGKADDDDEEPSDEDDEGEEEGEDLFEDKPKTPKGWNPKTYARFKKVIGQRNDLREKLETIEGRLELNQEIQKLLDGEYSKFEDPLAQVRWDSGFTTALESLIKADPSFSQFAQAVLHHWKTGEVPKMSDQQKTATNTAVVPPLKGDDDAPKTDPRVDSIIESNARSTVDRVLTERGAKPSFRAIVADYIVGSNLDLAALKPPEVMRFAKDFIKDKGFTEADVLEPKTEDGDKPRKPATGGRKAAAIKAGGSDDKGGNTDQPGKDAPKTLDEWEKNRSQRLDSFLGSTS